MDAFVGVSTFVSRPGSLRTGGRVCALRKRATAMVAASETHTLQGMNISKTPRPVRNFVFVRRADASESTAGGILLSTNAREKTNFGSVLSVGEGGCYRLTGEKMPIVVKPGDSVMFGRYGGMEVEFDGANHMFVDQFDLSCTLRNGKYDADSVEPLFDKVFVRITKAPEQTASGIMIAPGASTNKNVGEVLAIGPGKHLENGQYESVPVKPGDQVLWADYVGTRVKFSDKEEYIMLRGSDILAAW